MKKLLTLFIIFASLAVQAQQNRWVVRSVVPEGDPQYNQSVNRLLTTRTDLDVCHPGYNIGEILSYVQLNATADNVVQIGTRPDALVSYTGVGNWRENVSVYSQRGWYARGNIPDGSGGVRIGWTQVSGQGDVRGCTNEIRISNPRITDSAVNGAEELFFSASLANENERLRVTVRDIGIGEGSALELNTGTHYSFDGRTTSRDVSLHLDEREVGNIYVLRVASEADPTNFAEYTFPVKSGGRILSINSDQMQFVIADSRNTGRDHIRIHRRHRGDDNRRSIQNFRTNSHPSFRETWSRSGGHVRRYSVRFDGHLRPFESVILNHSRSGGPSNNILQLNGPIVRFTWDVTRCRNCNSRRDDSFTGGYAYNAELPPGWNPSNVQEINDDGYGRHYTGIDGTFSPHHNTYGSNPRHGAVAGPAAWELRDNWVEMGWRARYAGQTYVVKIWDHISHGDNRLGHRNQRDNHHDNGGVYNKPTVNGMVIGNIDHSQSEGTNGYQAGRDLNFNTSW